MPRLALNRKDMGWRIDWLQALVFAVLAGFPASLTENAFSMAVSWPVAAHSSALGLPLAADSRNRGHIAS
jgi:hypothetical protein